MSRRATVRAVLAAAILVVGLIFSLLASRSDPSPRTSTSPSAGATVGADDGLGTIRVSQLPSQARDTLALIAKGGPYPYTQDDTVFQNREKILPKQKSGYYREYTVKTPGSSTRGARRIVIGGKGTEQVKYYTSDHYESFKRIVEG